MITSSPGAEAAYYPVELVHVGVNLRAGISVKFQKRPRRSIEVRDAIILRALHVAGQSREFLDRGVKNLDGRIALFKREVFDGLRRVDGLSIDGHMTQSPDCVHHVAAKRNAVRDAGQVRRTAYAFRSACSKEIVMDREEIRLGSRSR